MIINFITGAASDTKTAVNNLSKRKISTAARRISTAARRIETSTAENDIKETSTKTRRKGSNDLAVETDGQWLTTDKSFGSNIQSNNCRGQVRRRSEDGEMSCKRQRMNEDEIMKPARYTYCMYFIILTGFFRVQPFT